MQIPDSPVVDFPPPRRASDNVYFDLDLKLPAKRPLFHPPPPAPPPTNNAVAKFDFSTSYRRTFGRDMTQNNPYFDPTVRRKRRKVVRFRVTEVTGEEGVLPHCRRLDQEGATPGLGHLHAPHCKNAAQETAEALGADVWQNRVFILESTRCGHRGNQFYDSEGTVIDSYYRAEQDELESVGVFDSVELQLQKLNTQEQGETRESPTCFEDEGEAGDLASLLEQVCAPSAPCNQDWFNADTPTAPLTPMNGRDWH